MVPASAVPVYTVPVPPVPVYMVPASAVPMYTVPVSAVSVSAVPASAAPMSAVPASAVPVSAGPLVSPWGLTPAWVPVSVLASASTVSVVVVLSIVNMIDPPYESVALPDTARAITADSVRRGGRPRGYHPASR